MLVKVTVILMEHLVRTDTPHDVVYIHVCIIMQMYNYTAICVKSHGGARQGTTCTNNSNFAIQDKDKDRWTSVASYANFAI